MDSGISKGAMRRLERQQRTLCVMISMYCRANHGTRKGLCPACQGLVDYSKRRVERCPFRAAKPTCVKCPVHCFRDAHRAEIRRVMTYAGPRMLPGHPILTLFHVVDSLRRVPVRAPGKRAAS